MVAALVRGVEDNEYNWILAEVVNYNVSTRQYEVRNLLFIYQQQTGGPSTN